MNADETWTGDWIARPKLRSTSFSISAKKNINRMKVHHQLSGTVRPKMRS